MKNVVKQVVGIDVAQKELVVCVGRMHDDWKPELYASKAFVNTQKGFNALLAWLRKQTSESIDTRFVMEATGVYHESFAHFLDGEGKDVTIVLPNKMSNYMRTLDVKTITDKTSAEAIARFGLERNLEKWKKPKAIYFQMKQLTRERDQVVQERTVAKNQLHAEEAGAYPLKGSLARIKQRIKLFDKQEEAIIEELRELISQDEEVRKIIDRMCSAPGVGLLTAAVILSETNGFELIRNKRQLASYAGFDVTEKQSGTSVKGRPRISKKGNKYLRKALYMPALSVVRSNEHFKAFFARLVSKHGVKMKAAVAVQRKLLELTYTLYKNKTTYDKNYTSNGAVDQTTEENQRSGK